MTGPVFDEVYALKQSRPGGGEWIQEHDSREDAIECRSQIGGVLVQRATLPGEVGKYWVEREFVCAVCKRRFISDPATTYEDRVAELETAENQAYPGDDKVSSVCDSCYPKVITWAREQGLIP